MKAQREPACPPTVVVGAISAAPRTARPALIAMSRHVPDLTAARGGGSRCSSEGAPRRPSRHGWPQQVEAQARAGVDLRERAALDRKTGNLLDVISDGRTSPAVMARLAELEAQKTRLGDLPLPTAEAIPVLPSNLAAAYTARVRDLHTALADRDHPEALEAARSLIEKVVVYPPETDNDPPRFELVGDLIALLQAGGVSDPHSGAQSARPDGVLSMLKEGSRGVVPLIPNRPDLARGFCQRF
jgi:hypothetical protein